MPFVEKKIGIIETIGLLIGISANLACLEGNSCLSLFIVKGPILKILPAILLVFGLSTSSIEENSVRVKVKITNIADEDSNVMIAVFDHYNHFLTDNMYRNKVVSVENFTETTFEFEVAPGEYAVAVFQDMNKNGDLDRNIFMFPSEPYGFSQNFRPVLKAPDWTDVAFKAYEDQTIEVELN